MARAHQFVSEQEASTLETPWGVFKVSAPNKDRLEQIEELQKEAEREDVGAVEAAELGIRSVAAALENGDEFRTHAMEAWNRGELTLAQIRGAATFVSEEIRGVIASGND